MDNFFPPMHWTNLLIIPSLLVGYTVHELGHNLTAYFLGDISQVEEEKITLNPFEHISWAGAFFFVLLGIGWPNPLQANSKWFKRKNRDMFLVAIAGPAASFTFSLAAFLLTVSVAATLVYVSETTTDRVFTLLFPTIQDMPQTLNVQAVAIAFTGYLATTSLWLTFISLLPLPGQDGFIAIITLATFIRERINVKKEIAVKLEREDKEDDPLISIDLDNHKNKVAVIHFKLGAEYHKKKKYDDAIARYRQAIRSNQNFGPAYLNMGLIYLAKGETKKAISAFQAATYYSADQKSEIEALHQLNRLKQVDQNNGKQDAQESMAEMGGKPITAIKQVPNWPGLVGNVLFLFIGCFILYSYLIIKLIEFLKI